MITFEILCGAIINNNIPSNAKIQCDNGMEYWNTELDRIYYNSKTNTLMITRKTSTLSLYTGNDDWQLLYKEEKE